MTPFALTFSDRLKPRQYLFWSFRWFNKNFCGNQRNPVCPDPDLQSYFCTMTTSHIFCVFTLRRCSGASIFLSCILYMIYRSVSYFTRFFVALFFASTSFICSWSFVASWLLTASLFMLSSWISACIYAFTRSFMPFSAAYSLLVLTLPFTSLLMSSKEASVILLC